MDWNVIGAIGQIVGAIAVVATLFYLAAQIRQNTALLTRADLNAAMEQASSIRRMVANDGELAQIIVRSRNDEPLSESERVRLEHWMAEVLWNASSGWRRNRLMDASPADWQRSYGRSVRLLLASKNGAAWWSQVRHQFDRDFQRDVDGTLALPPADPQ